MSKGRDVLCAVADGLARKGAARWLGAARLQVATQALVCCSLLHALASQASPSDAVAKSSASGQVDACSTISMRIEESEKQIAYLLASGIGDNSAPRETTRLLSRLSEQEFQSQQLAMMVALRCPKLPVEAISKGARYLAAALSCESATIGANGLSKADAPQVCDRKLWQPSSPASAAVKP